jgi:hypothetical protein
MAELEKIKDYQSVWTPVSFTPDNHDGIRRMRFFKVVDENVKREVLPGWYGSNELMEECLKRSLKEYVPNLTKEYLDMIGYKGH